MKRIIKRRLIGFDSEMENQFQTLLLSKQQEGKRITATSLFKEILSDYYNRYAAKQVEAALSAPELSEVDMASEAVYREAIEAPLQEPPLVVTYGRDDEDSFTHDTRRDRQTIVFHRTNISIFEDEIINDGGD